MAASLADYPRRPQAYGGPAEQPAQDAATADAAPARERRGPSPRVAALLSLLTPGLGHVYIGQARLGIALAAGVIAADTLLVFAMMGVLARFWMFVVSLALLLALWLFIIVDAAVRAHRTPAHKTYSRWAAAPAFVLAWVAFAGLCVYAVHAKAAGRLLWFNAVTPSMAPTLRAGEYFLADATPDRKVGFGDHARVESGAIIGSKAGVLPGKIVRRGEVYWGVPVRPLREYKRLNALFGRLPEMKEQIERLQEQVLRLEEEMKRRSGNRE